MPKTPPKGGYDLRASPFFRLRSRRKLADLLRVSPSALAEIAAASDLYLRRWKHKKLDLWTKDEPQGEAATEYRPIDIPDPRLKAMQSRVADLLSRIAPPDFLFSPVKGRSYVDNAAHHIGARAFWQLDVANYFPSCSSNSVARFFGRDLECSPDVVAILVSITTYSACLPQGSPCSPILAYFANLPMWTAVARLAEAEGCRLSVYADDITLSGQVVPKALIWKIKQTIHKHGLRLKPSKEVSLISAPADITGVIVRDGKTFLPNRQLKKLVELRSERALACNPKLKIRLGNQIAGRKAQRRQVEGR